MSIVGLMLLAPLLANFAMKFGPPEMFAVFLIAFILLGSLGSGSFFKTMPMVFMGMLLGTIGMDPLTGVLRFTHGSKDLYDGLGVLPVAMGAFGIGEILSSTEEDLVRTIKKVRLLELLPTRKELRASLGPVFRGSGLGFLIGLLPGAAHVLASFVRFNIRAAVSFVLRDTKNLRSDGAAIPSNVQMITITRTISKRVNPVL